MGTPIQNGTDEVSCDRRRNNWRLLLYTAPIASAIFLVHNTINGYDFFEITYLFIGIPIISLAVVLTIFIYAIRKYGKPSLSTFLILPVFWAVTWVLYMNSVALRTHTRWLFISSSYKAQVLAQPQPPNSELKHVEWDGWGFAGLETNEYLVYDPNNQLASAKKSGSGLKANGIPCEVPSIHRMENHWYTVVFYTETDWNNCTYN